VILNKGGEGDANKDGWVDSDELYSYVKGEVEEQARKLGYQQHPQKSGEGQSVRLTRAMQSK